MTVNTADNRYGVAQLIVAPTIAEGANYSTIASALTAAVSGQTIFIRPGTYTENLTLKAGVNICSFSSEPFTPNVTIIGKLTATFAGSCTISGIRLQTNSDNFLAVTGSSATVITLVQCFLNCSNNTGITFSSSSSSASITFRNCSGNLATTGIAYFSHSSAGGLLFSFCGLSNSGLSTVANTVSAGSCNFVYSNIDSPITTSSTSIFGFLNSRIETSGINTTSLTIDGSGAQNIQQSYVNSGTASAISVGSALGAIDQCLIGSSNTNCITGAGTINYGSILFGSTSSTMNTTNQAPKIFRPGIILNDKQPAFLAYLATTALNKTGNGASYTIGADALTEVFDQNNNFNTNGTFTAPYTGRYNLTAQATLIGVTIMAAMNLTLITSNRSYIYSNAKGANAFNLTAMLNILADMDAADTFTCTILAVGEAGDTDDVQGVTPFGTFMSGYLAC